MKRAYQIEMTVMHQYARQLLALGVFVAACTCVGMGSIVAAPGTGRVAAASTQERTCAATSSTVGMRRGSSSGDCEGCTGDNGVFSSFGITATVQCGGERTVPGDHAVAVP